MNSSILSFRGKSKSFGLLVRDQVKHKASVSPFDDLWCRCGKSKMSAPSDWAAGPENRCLTAWCSAVLPLYTETRTRHWPDPRIKPRLLESSGTSIEDPLWTTRVVISVIKLDIRGQPWNAEEDGFCRQKRSIGLLTLFAAERQCQTAPLSFGVSGFWWQWLNCWMSCTVLARLKE